ncbi:MAG: TetR/AcrR family transcriptional regulator, partial [Bacteroidia bacterium]|nr:TetR/AcrR family transcriptional regulator [Bacteroidia bacterium]
IKRVTMDEIAKDLHISKKTIYENFNNKTEIISSLVIHDFNQHKVEFESMKERSQNAIDELVGVLQYVTRLYKEINPNFFYDIHKHYYSAWEQLQKFKDEWMLKTIEDNLRSGIEEGLYRDSIRINVISRMRMIQFEGLMDPQSYPPREFDLVEVQKQLLEHFIFGITTLKGHKLFEKKLKQIESALVKQ